MVRASQRQGAGPSKDILNSDAVQPTTPLRRSRSVQRLKSFCGAKPTQKLRWTERGWGRGFGFRLWNFQLGLACWRRLRGASRGLWAVPSSPLRPVEAGVRSRQPWFRAHKPGDRRRRAKCVGGAPEACEDELAFVSGDGLAGHGAWARFGESWRTNRRRPAPQQGQTRGPSGLSGAVDGSAACALHWACGGPA